MPSITNFNYFSDEKSITYEKLYIYDAIHHLDNLNFFPALVLLSCLAQCLEYSISNREVASSGLPSGILTISSWLSSRNFFQGGAKSIVMQISIVMLLFSDQISGRGTSFQGGQTASGGGAPCPPPVEESQPLCWYQEYLCPVEPMYFSDEKSITDEK